MSKQAKGFAPGVVVSTTTPLAALCALVVAIGAFGPESGWAADANQAWQDPFAIELPQPARSLMLRSGTDPYSWAEARGLKNVRVVSNGKAGSLLETRMSDADWQQAEQTVCGDGAVSSCETVACQAIQLEGDVATAAGEGDIKARLVKNPPELAPVPDAADDADGEAGTCHGPPLIPWLASESQVQTIPINLQLDAFTSGRGGSKDAPRTDAGTGTGTEPGTGPGTGTDSGSGADTAVGTAQGSGVGRRSFQFSLDSAFNALGGRRLNASALPEDTSEWTMVVASGCTEVSVPLDSLVPARVRNRIAALVDGGTTAAVAGTYGLTVIREVTLDTTQQTLAVFEASGSAVGTAASIAALLLDARVSAAQPEFIYRTTAQAPAYSDPFAFLSYGPEKTGALGLHGAATGKGQLVAVIDTGVELDHPELVNRLRDHVDVTDQGWSADLHGTAVAGIIAANADNGLGIYGVAPEAELLAIKACQPTSANGLEARCWTSTLVKALDVAMQNDAGVINMSLTGPPDDLLARFVKLAVDQDRLLVAAAGNGGAEAKPGFPAALPGVLGVTAVDASERRYGQANVGSYVDVAAPGVDIISPAPGGVYPTLSGTSMAAAHVAGVAALMRELVPLMSGRELHAVLKSNTRDLGSQGLDEEFGTGLIDACGAARIATADAIECASATEETADEPATSFPRL